MANEEQAQRFRMFYYRGISDPVTKWGYVAADFVVAVFGLFFLWVLVRHLLGL